MSARAILKNRLREFRRAKDGLAAVEFAFLLPVVLTMFSAWWKFTGAELPRRRHQCGEHACRSGGTGSQVTTADMIECLRPPPMRSCIPMTPAWPNDRHQPDDNAAWPDTGQGRLELHQERHRRTKKRRRHPARRIDDHGGAL